MNAVAKTSYSHSPKICLLGLVKDLVPSIAEGTHPGFLLFYAKRTSALEKAHFSLHSLPEAASELQIIPVSGHLQQQKLSQKIY